MTTIAKGMITLTSVNDAYSASFTPSSCVINAKWNGEAPDYSNAYADLTVCCGGEAKPFEIIDVSTTNIGDCNAVDLANNVKRVKITEIANGALSGCVSLQIKCGNDFVTWVNLPYTVVRETSMLDWILDWEGREKTEIAGEHIITPKIFVGKSADGGKLTGTYIGPAFDGSKKVGVFGYSAGKEIFHLDNTGGMIGGWLIENGGIQTSDGALKILSEGTIISAPNGSMAWKLNKDGSATFAGGDVSLKKGVSIFKGEIHAKAGVVGGWNIGAQSLYNSEILINATEKFIGLRNKSSNQTGEPTKTSFITDIQNYGGVSIFFESSVNYGIECWNPATADSITKVFSLGSQNSIAGWSFDNEALWLGIKNNTSRQSTCQSGHITIGSAGLRGMNWFIDNDGEISFVDGLLHFDKNGGSISGWILNPNRFSANHAALISQNSFCGIYLTLGDIASCPDSSVHDIVVSKGGIEIVANGYQSYVRAWETDGTSSFYLSSDPQDVNRIGGWCFDGNAIFRGPKNTQYGKFSSPDCITLGVTGLRGATWRLEADGSGAVAKGNISWDAIGTVTFAPSVVLSWGQITGTELVTNKLTQIDANGIYVGTINANNITSGTISAERLNLDELLSNGEKWALLKNGSGYLASKNISWKADGALFIKGEIEATSGMIGGFKIKGDLITNEDEGPDNQAAIIFRNDVYGLYGAIGRNVMPVESGVKAVARFENCELPKAEAIGSRNIAMYLAAKNALYNHAFKGEGNGTLNGWFAGYKYGKLLLSQANKMYYGLACFDLSKTNQWICKSTATNCGAMLPSLNDVQNALGIGYNEPFCIELTILADVGTTSFKIYGRNTESTQWNTDQYPLFLHWDGGRWEFQELGAGDSFRILLIYDPMETETLYGNSLKYTARTINKQS